MANHEYNRGYQDGYASRFDDDSATHNTDYARGWEDGNADRPSLDEVTYDPTSETSNPLGQ